MATEGQISNNECDHKSVGTLVFKNTDDQESKLLLIQRKKFPFGFAPPAGHIDEAGTYQAAAKKELKEEVGLEASELVEVIRGRRENECRRPDGNYHSWRVYSAEVGGEVQRSLEETLSVGWYSHQEVEKLAERTQMYRDGNISHDEWEINPGLEKVWYDSFQQIGILEDPEQLQKQRIPSFIYNRRPIIGRYYGREYEKTQAAAKAFSSLGIPSYPRPNAESITITSPDGDTFSFLGGSQLTISPHEAQQGFFREVKRTHDIPMVNNFIYVAIQDGYLGRTASIEVAYAIATYKRIIFSESPSKFSHELPSEIISIIRANHGRYPHLPVEDIPTDLPEALQYKIDKPDLDVRQRKKIFFSILKLIRDLHKKFD